MWHINDKIGSLSFLDDYGSGETAGRFSLAAEELAQCGHESFASSVIKVLASPVCSDAYFAVSATGELVYAEAQDPLLDRFMRQKYVFAFVI